MHESRSPAPIAGEQSSRLLGFDVVRTVAALGVIWVHAGRSPFWNDHDVLAAGTWGTAYLNMIAGFFVVRSLAKHDARGAWGFVCRRVVRLYGAFLVWSVIYLGARVVNYYVFHKVSALFQSGSADRAGWDMLFFGTTYHLWFPPYLICVTLLTLPFVLLAMRSKEAMVIGALLLAIVAAALLLLPVPGVFLHGGVSMLPLERLYTRASGYIIGLALGLWIQAGFRPRVEVRHAWVCAGIIVAAIYLKLASEFPPPILNRVAALAAFMIALAPWRGRVAVALGKMGQLGFGVYLCHVLIVEGTIATLRRMSVPSSFGVDVLVFVIAVVGSFALSYAMRKVRWLAWLIP